MGDPTHVPNLAVDVGNSTKAGLFPRQDTAACGSLAAVTQSYCNSDDKFCDSGNSVAVHISYVQVYGSTAAQYVVNQVTGNSTSKLTANAVNGNNNLSASSALRVSVAGLLGSVIAVAGLLI